MFIDKASLHRAPSLRLILAVLLIGGPLLAFVQRVDSFDMAGITVTVAELAPLADGGCTVRWCGSVTSLDGGVTLSTCTAPVELATTANRTRCSGILGAGEPRLARELRLAQDAGPSP